MRVESLDLLLLVQWLAVDSSSALQLLKGGLDRPTRSLTIMLRTKHAMVFMNFLFRRQTARWWRSEWKQSCSPCLTTLGTKAAMGVGDLVIYLPSFSWAGLTRTEAVCAEISGQAGGGCVSAPRGWAFRLPRRSLEMCILTSNHPGAAG